MKKNDVFTFTAPNGVEVTAVCLDVTHSFQCGEDTWYYEYFCYAQNRLFIGSTYTVYENDEYKEYDFTQERIVVDYAVLPDYDAVLEDYWHQLDMADDYASKEY